jgi:hypothetical protein
VSSVQTPSSRFILRLGSELWDLAVLLLEIISGRHAIDVNYSPPSVVEWAVSLIKHVEFFEICDSRINSRIQLSKPSRTCSTSCPPSSWPVGWGGASEQALTALQNVFVGFVLCNPIRYWVVFRFAVMTRLIIGSGSCWIQLCNRVSRINTNPTRWPELPTLSDTKSIMNASQPDLPPEGVFDGFLYLRADP